MGRSLSAPAIIGRAPTSNGYARRKIIQTSGAYNFQLPNDANDCEVAIFGGGGGGALRVFQSGTQPDATPGGGGGGGFSRRRFLSANGGLISGSVGAAGLGGKFDMPSGGGGAGMVAGSNGGTSTATLNGVTITATGGAGAVSPLTGGVVTRAAGGVGSGGEISSNGGQGGGNANPNFSAQISSLQAVFFAPGGGGSSGSHRGDGGRGGDAMFNNSLTPLPGAGGGWGGNGGDAFGDGNTSIMLSNHGGGSMAAGRNFTFFINQYGRPVSLFFGIGGSKFVPFASMADAQMQFGVDWNVPLIEDWWDISEIRGWAGGILYQLSNNGYIMAYPAGPGGGGSSTGSDTGHSTSGFGGGAAGVKSSIEGTLLISPKAAGGVGGGGAGRFVEGAAGGGQFNGRSIYGGNGGPGCVIIWY